MSKTSTDCVEILRQKSYGIIMDPSKVEAITKWPGLRGPYYADEKGLRKEVCGGGIKYEPSARVIEELKTEIGVAIDIDSSISGFSVVLDIQVDASKKGLGCVLMQHGRLDRLRFQGS
ncbi:hypothetical protein Tco_0408477 [Tanacetum coccineum]